MLLGFLGTVLGHVELGLGALLKAVVGTVGLLVGDVLTFL